MKGNKASPGRTLGGFKVSEIAQGSKFKERQPNESEQDLKDRAFYEAEPTKVGCSQLLTCCHTQILRSQLTPLSKVNEWCVHLVDVLGSFCHVFFWRQRNRDFNEC